MKLPFTTSATEEPQLVMKVERISKVFPVNTKLQLSADEFAGVAWTQLSASQWAAERLEKIGRSSGLAIQSPKLTETSVTG
jgi:hypothetical protein